MNSMQLMSTRLRMPQPRKRYIVRKELFTRLDELDEYKVAVIKGGAGSGKTTLITSFVKERSITNLKWISLDENCNDVFLFWSYFIEAIKDYLGNSKKDFMSIYDSNFQKNNLEKLLIMLINTLDTEENIFIALDDFQHIKDEFLIGTIDFFLKNISDNIHLILLTREEPLIYLGEINMEGKLLDINENDLKLPTEEGISFLENTLELRFSRETLDFINKLAEGWIGGIQLIAAAARGKSEKEICSLKPDNKIVAEYLTKEVYDVLSLEEKNFLVVTSILAYFNEEICSDLIEDIDFKKIISSLVQRNLLIISIDDEKGIYRYHNILGEYLRLRFTELNKNKRMDLHLKAGDIYKKLGDLDECINQLLLAEDYLSAMQTILKLPQNATTFSYMVRIPEIYIIRNPDFAYQCFFYHYANMEFEKCRNIYDLIKNSMKDDPTFEAFKYSYMFVEDTFRVNEVKVMSADEIDNLPLNSDTKAFVLIKDASFLYAQARYDEALSFINKVLDYTKDNVNPYAVFFALGVKAQIFEETGNFNKCLDMYKEMERISSSVNSPSMFFSTFYISITGVYLKQMDIEASEKALNTVSECLEEKLLSVDRGYRYNLAEYKFITGDTKAASQIVHELISMKIYKNTVYIAQLLKYMFKYGEATEEIIQKYIENYKNAPDNHKNLEAKLFYDRILFSCGKSEEAMKNVDEILKYSRKNEIKLKIVEASLFKIYMLLNLSTISTENKRQIINLFKEAVFYSFENRIKLPFHFERETVEKVLKQYGNEIQENLTAEEKEYIEEIKNAINVIYHFSDKSNQASESETKNILTYREIEVLQQLATGISNKEIGEKLCISLATVKSHIINIYTKLQVNSRVAAVEAGKQMSIL